MELERENARLKKLLAEAHLEKSMIDLARDRTTKHAHRVYSRACDRVRVAVDVAFDQLTMSLRFVYSAHA